MFFTFLTCFVSPDFQVVVQQVHIDGLGRTKEDLLTYEIADVFRAKNLIDVGARKRRHTNTLQVLVMTDINIRLTVLFKVMKRSHEARQKLLRLGIFRKVEVVIDTSRGTVYHCTV